MSDFDQLLEVQALDMAADQARKQCASMPERASLAAEESEGQRLAQLLTDLRAQQAEHASTQRAREGEVSLVEEKARQVSENLYSGTVTAAKELAVLQEELGLLKKRQAELEESVLEVMEQVEALESEEADLVEKDQGRVARADVLRDGIAAAEAELEQILAGLDKQREAAAPLVPEALLKSYERLRPRLTPPAVVRLEKGTCKGCHVTLPALLYTEIRRKPPDEVVTCPQCSRMLVR